MNQSGGILNLGKTLQEADARARRLHDAVTVNNDKLTTVVKELKSLNTNLKALIKVMEKKG